MISAEFARKNAGITLERQGNREQEMIEEKIKEAIDEGEFTCVFENYIISYSTASLLKSLGYKLQIIHGNSTRIYWL